ncbi:hypothetical protein BDZ91DRAFT_731461 [Kalaharituber pfeilii]|nr:hypothetical protein BDZ91DRAFT_731461 [Kalaharituber pfeilii]
MGPYKIRDIKRGRGTNLITELDGTLLEGPISGDGIKRKYARRGIDLEDAGQNSDSSVEEENSAYIRTPDRTEVTTV